MQIDPGLIKLIIMLIIVTEVDKLRSYISQYDTESYRSYLTITYLLYVSDPLNNYFSFWGSVFKTRSLKQIFRHVFPIGSFLIIVFISEPSFLQVLSAHISLLVISVIMSDFRIKFFSLSSLGILRLRADT